MQGLDAGGVGGGVGLGRRRVRGHRGRRRATYVAAPGGGGGGARGQTLAGEGRAGAGGCCGLKG